MILRLQQVLTPEELATAREMLAHPGVFADGAGTAAGAARAVKHNEQAGGARADTVTALVRKALARHDAYNAFAIPKSIVRVLASRYRPGMSYGQHIDAAVMGGKRVDLSFTLFLSDPASYEGGALVIDDATGETEVKLAAGDAVLYATSALHRVEQVRAGERLAAVGWVRSLVRRADQRECLFDLDLAAREAFAAHGHGQAHDRLLKVRANLLRMWAED